MDFFKSILSDDPVHPEPESDPNSPLKQPIDDSNSNDVADGDLADGWSFGGLIKTLAIRSESVIETYSRDLKEFGSGLKKETEIFRETASRAVKDLPASIEASASALDGVLKSTAGMISKESLGFASDGDPETPDTNQSRNSGRYSWFESQLSAMQSDLNTFCEEPEDVEEYRNWKLGFELEEFRDEIDSLIEKNGTLEGVYRKVVPSGVDSETFWCRYFYRMHKLKQQESVRANLVKRAICGDDEEELSWDVDDEEDSSESERTSGLKEKGEDGEGDNVASDQNLYPVVKQEGSKSGSLDEKESNVNVDDGEKNSVFESSEKSNADVSSDEKEVKSGEFAEEKVKSEESSKEKNDEKVGVEEKGESSKKIDASMVHQSNVVEDMGWDEIEDTGSGDEKKPSVTSHGSPNRKNMQKRLSTAEEDEDLSWDIEDDDEPVKA